MRRTCRCLLDILDRFQSALEISLELLQIPVFPFASLRAVQYLIGQHHRPGSLLE